MVAVEAVDKSNTGVDTCAIGVQSKDVASASVAPQCDLSLTASEEFAAFWFAVRSLASSPIPTADVSFTLLIQRRQAHTLLLQRRQAHMLLVGRKLAFDVETT